MRKDVGFSLRDARKLRGLTQSDLAALLGVHQQEVSRIERGEASYERVVDVCRALGLGLSLAIGERTVTLVHPIHPLERKEIEANLDWFQRLEPEERLRSIARHMKAARILREAGTREG